jgi:hypothetical protein
VIEVGRLNGSRVSINEFMRIFIVADSASAHDAVPMSNDDVAPTLFRHGSS